MSTDLLPAALSYAERGWPVFMLGRTKRPVALCQPCQAAKDAGTPHDREACDCLTCHGFYAATTDPYRINAMLAAVPYGKLAIRTGAASGLVVVDVDPRKGGDETMRGLANSGMLPRTRYVRTGSDGWHLYYRHPGHFVPCGTDRLGAGIDVKSDGGYVVAWADGAAPINEMHPSLIAACALVTAVPPQRGPAVRPTATPTRAGCISAPDRLLKVLLDKVADAPEGRRRRDLWANAQGVARIVAAGAISHADAVAALEDAAAVASARGSHRLTGAQIRNAITDGFAAEGVRA